MPLRPTVRYPARPVSQLNAASTPRAWSWMKATPSGPLYRALTSSSVVRMMRMGGAAASVSISAWAAIRATQAPPLQSMTPGP